MLSALSLSVRAASPWVHGENSLLPSPLSPAGGEHEPLASEHERNEHSVLPGDVDGYSWVLDEGRAEELMKEQENDKKKKATNSDGTTSHKRPHVFMWVVDDQGWGNVGYHNHHVYTPTMDKYAKAGVILDRHYTYTWCSPSRASLLTGRLPYHVLEDDNQMVPANMVMLPALLKKAGYTTAQVGKWHLGNYHSWQTPRSRGFDTSFGYLGATVDYHTLEQKATAWPCDGFDSWENDKPAYNTSNTGITLSLHAKHIGDLITRHAKKSNPLFVYVALQAMHSPIPDPPVKTEHYSGYSKGFAIANGLISAADEVLDFTIEALKTEKMFAHTLLIHTSDNGGSITPLPIEVRGTNYPLRGGKNGAFEGGVRVPAFLTGGFLPPSMHGKTLDGMIHIADWYTTVARLAGLKLSSTSTKPDGHDMVDYIRGNLAQSPRTELMLSTKNVRTGSMDALINVTSDGRMWKYIHGKGLCTGYSSQKYPTPDENDLNCDATEGNARFKGEWEHSDLGVGAERWLFDLAKDPNESQNLIDKYAHIAEDMQALLDERKKTKRYHSDPDKTKRSKSELKKKCEAYTSQHRGYLGPFM